jgi:hypothetical protein
MQENNDAALGSRVQLNGPRFFTLVAQLRRPQSRPYDVGNVGSALSFWSSSARAASPRVELKERRCPQVHDVRLRIVRIRACKLCRLLHVHLGSTKGRSRPRFTSSGMVERRRRSEETAKTVDRSSRGSNPARHGDLKPSESVKPSKGQSLAAATRRHHEQRSVEAPGV